RPTISGYLPSSGPTGNRTRISSLPNWCRPRWTMSPFSQGSGDRTHVLQLPRLADHRFPIPCSVDREGVAPSFPASGAGVVLLDQQPVVSIDFTLSGSGRRSRTFIAWFKARQPTH